MSWAPGAGTVLATEKSRDYMVRPPAISDATARPAGEIDAPEEPWNADPEVRTSIVAAALHGQRLDKVVVGLAGEFSRTHLQGLIGNGHVRLDGLIAASASRKVSAGQALHVELVPTAQSRAFRPESIPLAIVHEDEAVIVLDKPAGMVVHPAAGNWAGTLLNALLAHHPGAASLPRAGIVHRLDKNTSGLMVVGKTLPAVTALVRAIASREVRRQYLAIAHGEVQPGAFSVEAPIGRDPQSRIRMAVVPSGKPARTDVLAVARYAGFSALQCLLHTGRTHQIRVHLAARGHPLVADAVYGGGPALGMTRQALHAECLCFAHPVSGEEILFHRAPPDDFQGAWRAIIDSAVEPSP